MEIYFYMVVAGLLLTTDAHSQSWLWARQPNYVGNPTNQADGEGYSVATDRQNNVYEVGFFAFANMYYGADTLQNISGNAFLVKYDSSGIVQWARQVAVSQDAKCQAYYVATDGTGNPFITGFFADTVFFGTYLLTTQAAPEIFIAKYDPNGNPLWAKQSHTTGYNGNYNEGLGICTDRFGNIYITGRYQYPTSFGPFTLSYPVGQSDQITGITGSVFLVKYDSTGNELWAKQGNIPSNTSFASANAVTTDAMGNVFITGSFNDTISFGAHILIAQSPAGEVFVARFDQNGNPLWVKQSANSSSAFGLPAPVSGNAIVTDKNGNIYVTGNFADTIYFGTTQLINPIPYQPYSYPYGDIFLAKYDANGNLDWAQAAYPLVNAAFAGWGLATDTFNHVYFVGGGVADYGFPNTKLNYSIKFGNDTFTCTGSSSIESSLLLKLDTSGKVLCGSILPVGGDDNSSVATDPTGTYVYEGGDFEVFQNNLTIGIGADTLRGNGNYGAEIPYVLRWQPCISCSVSSSIATIKDTICAGDTVYLNEGGSTGNVQWQSAVGGNNFTNIPGADSIALSETPQQTTAYRLVKTSGACSDTSSPLTIVALPLSAAPQLTVSDSVICSDDSAEVCALGNYATYEWNTGETTSCIEVKSAGGYWLTVAETDGCPVVSGHRYVAVYPVSPVSIVVRGDTLSSFNAVAYQWFLNDTAIPNATNAVYITTEPGLYSVEITDTNGCKEISNQTYVITGVRDLNGAGGVNVYPNPFRDNVVIQTNDARIYTVKIYDMVGRKLLDETSNSFLIKVDVTGLPPALYLMMVKTNTNQYSLKICKQ